jgi:DNA-binding PadR family transcriptional regulator
MSKLLINESPLMFQPTLATKIGVNEAIALQQLHYLLNPKFNKNIKDSKCWVYNSYPEWKEKEFPFWSEGTIQRVFLSLEKQSLVDSRRLTKNSRDRTKWYTINYDNVSKLDLVVGTSPQNAMMEPHDRKMRSCITADCGLASPQNAMMSKVQEITQEITQENKQHAREAAPETKAVEQLKAEPSIGLMADPVCDEPVQEIPEEHPEPKAATPRPAKPKTASQQEFELFWLAYVLKVGKGAAVKAFDRSEKKFALQAKKNPTPCSAMGDTSKTFLGAILGALEAQKAERAERERLGLWSPSWKHPATWLNQECWNDVPKTAEEMRKEVEAKQATRNPVGQKKPSYSDRVQAANRAMGSIMEEYYPDMLKHFPELMPEPKQTNFNIPQLREEIVVNAI